MRNYIQAGDNVTIAAPVGGVVSGDGVLVGSLFGIAAATVLAGESVELVSRGVFELPKAAGTLDVGDKAYWITADKAVTGTASGNKLVGVVIRAAATDAPTVRVRLNGISV